MQAIFLTEIFARFRAKRSDICFSPQFVGMYKKVSILILAVKFRLNCSSSSMMGLLIA